LATTFKQEKLVANAVKVFFLILSALFPIVDPLAGSPFFLALTKQYSPEMRRGLSRRVAMNNLFLMIGAYFTGAHILNIFGVSLAVVQVGGGLVVVAMGGGMLLANEEAADAARRNIQCQDAFDRAFYPLTLPLTVGPSSISVAVTLGANSTHRYGFHISIILAALLAMGLIAASIALCYGFADRLARMLGKTAMTVILRLSAFLLVSIGVQITWNGMGTLLSSVHLHVG
jgi:multiple antibiotic resistance protein